MHVHLSQTPPWTTTDLESIAKAVVSFNNVFGTVFPRRRKKFCKPNSRVSGKLRRLLSKGGGFRLSLRSIDQETEEQSLINFLSPSRNTAINFRSLTDSVNRRTIEFRLFPSSSYYKYIYNNVLLAAAFVTAVTNSIYSADYHDGKENATLEDLETFLCSQPIHIDGNVHPPLFQYLFSDRIKAQKKKKGRKRARRHQEEEESEEEAQCREEEEQYQSSDIPWGEIIGGTTN
jgi:hypothetical protein